MIRRILAAALLGIGQFQAVAQTDAVLHEGTPVRMRINRTISSATEKQGDTVDFETLDDVKLSDAVIIPKGSTAMATVTEGQSKKSMGRAGKMNVNIDYVRLPSGDKLALRGVQDASGGGHVGAMTGAIVATSIVFFPAAPLFLFMKGKDITIPKGHEVTVYTNSDYDTSKGKPPATQVVKAGAMTNADVLALKGAGLGDQVIIDKIKGSQSSFKTEASDLVELKKAGLSDAVISAMIAAH